MKKVALIVFTAAALLALSGLAYSENIGSSTEEQVDSGTSSNSNTENSTDSDTTGNDTDTAPATSGESESGDNPGGSPDGVMGNYSGATNDDGGTPPSEGHEEATP